MTLIISIGSDQKKPGQFYWDVKDAGMTPIAYQGGFKSLEDAYNGFEKFKRDMMNAEKADIKIINR